MNAKVTNAVADNLKLSSNPNNTSTWNKVEDGQLVIQKNYAVLYVFPDGSTDLFVDGLSGQALNSDWGPFWLSDIKDKYPERYDAYVISFLEKSKKETYWGVFGLSFTTRARGQRAENGVDSCHRLFKLIKILTQCPLIIHFFLAIIKQRINYQRFFC